MAGLLTPRNRGIPVAPATAHAKHNARYRDVGKVPVGLAALVEFAGPNDQSRAVDVPIGALLGDLVKATDALRPLLVRLIGKVEALTGAVLRQQTIDPQVGVVDLGVPYAVKATVTLRELLGREPTLDEVRDEVRRILNTV